MQIGTGTKIRDYVVISLIARGGMGEIFLAREELLNRQVVLKRLQSGLTSQEEFYRRFVNEARIQAQLKHPNIIQLFNFFEQDGDYFMVLEYFPGITLLELSGNTGPIPERRCLRIFEQLASALNYAHSLGVIHRDIKAQNIMVDPANGDLVKILDFGIARILGDAHLTRQGNYVGTPLYMSPEQLLGQPDVDHRTDIYSAGVLLYELLSGSLPYAGGADSEYELKRRVLEQSFPDPREKYPHISQATVDLLRRLTAKDRNDRPFKLILPSAATTFGPAEPLPDWTPPSAGEQVSPSPPDPAPQKRGPWLWLAVALLALLLSLALLEVFGVTNFVGGGDDGWDLSEDPEWSEATLPEGMVLVKGGSFQIGTGQENTVSNPPAKVKVSSFLIGKHEVTQAEWIAVMGGNPSTYEGLDHPVETVSWYGAVEYCLRRSEQEGLTPCYRISTSPDPGNLNPEDPYHWTVVVDWDASGYRLPTETEWEFAARGGNLSRGYLYSGSNSLNDVGWYGKTSAKTRPVGGKSANELGIHDMTGNVWEWCWDWHRGNGYRFLKGTDPRGADSDSLRVMRGGSTINQDPSYCTVFKRNAKAPHESYKYIGFRVCRAAR